MTNRDQHQQIRRLLALVPYLNRHDSVDLQRAAQDFGTTGAQLLRDLRVLWMCGLPGLGPGDLMDIDMDALESGGDGVIRLSNAEYLDRPLRLNSAEAGALILALQASREASDPETHDVIDRALAKLRQAVSDSVLSDVVSPTSASPSSTAAIRQALADGRRLSLDYYVAARDEDTRRDVDPLALLRAEGLDYLDAWCHRAQARRLFRVDQITRIEVLAVPAGQHRLDELDLSGGVLLPDAAATAVRLHLDRVARWVAEYYPVESQTETGDGGLEVTMNVLEPPWLVRLVMRLAPYVTVLEPPELVERVRRTIDTTLAGYDEASLTARAGLQ